MVESRNANPKRRRKVASYQHHTQRQSERLFDAIPPLFDPMQRDGDFQRFLGTSTSAASNGELDLIANIVIFQLVEEGVDRFHRLAVDGDNQVSQEDVSLFVAADGNEPGLVSGATRFDVANQG